MFNLQGVEIAVPRATAFGVVADPARLPSWTEAFAAVDGTRAVMRTPQGEVPVTLAVDAAAHQGTIDWHMTFPDGSVAAAFSRLVALGPERCLLTFVLTPPPGPLEAIEGTLDAQARTLTRELAALKRLLERRPRDA